MTTPVPDLCAPIGRLGLGTVQFGLAYGVSNAVGQVGEATARAIVGRALGAGMRFLDTAAAYGTSEEVLARVLPAGHPGAIVTKTLPLARGGLALTLQRIRTSIELFGTVDTLLVHSAADFEGPDGDRLWAALTALRDAGEVRRIGISAYHADDPAALARRFGPDVIQVPVSLLDQRLVRDGTLATLARQGVEIHARSLFLQGLIFLPTDRLPAKLAAIAPRLDAIRTQLAVAGLSPLEASLGYALAEPAIAACIVGVTSTAELDEILAAAARPPPSDLDWTRFAIEDALVLNPALW